MRAGQKRPDQSGLSLARYLGLDVRSEARPFTSLRVRSTYIDDSPIPLGRHGEMGSANQNSRLSYDLAFCSVEIEHAQRGHLMVMRLLMST